MSPLTKGVRPPVLLTPEKVEQARAMARAGRGVLAIMAAFGVSEEAVIQALAPMRMRNTRASRGTLNVTLATLDFVKSQSLPNEAIWKTVGRLLTELVMLRAELITLRAMKGGL